MSSDHILHLDAAHGDEGYTGLRFVMHDQTDDTSLGEVARGGFTVPQGRAVFSGTLSNQSRRTLIIQVPGALHIGYAVGSSAQVNRTTKAVTGNPLSYAAGRRRLAVYTDIDTETARRAAEENLSQGMSPEQLPGLVISQDHIVGWLDASSGLKQIVGELEQAVRTLRQPSILTLEQALGELVHTEGHELLVSRGDLARLLLESTTETRLMNRLRMMRWQMLAQGGYSFTEDGQALDIPRYGGLEELQRQLQTATLFAGRLAWLGSITETAVRTMATEARSN